MVSVSSPNSRPCSPACRMAVPRAGDSPSLLLVTATLASGPGTHHPGYPNCTLGGTECARQRPRAARRDPLCTGSGHPVTSSRGPAEVLWADRVEELAELL